jgi:hypothetical protein
MTRFIKKVIVFSSPIIILLIIVNGIIDPANIMSGVEKKIAEYLTEGYNVTNITDMDERLLQKYVIENLTDPPEIIILGSSRIMQIGRYYYGDNCLNNGVSGASIEDLMAIYQLYIEKDYDKSIRKIVIGIDPWIFNKNSGQYRWKSIGNEYNNFKNKNTSTKKYLFFKYSRLISPSYFQASIRNIPKFLLKEKGELSIMPTYEWVNDTLTREIDGTVIYDIKTRSLTESEISEKINSYINAEIYSLENYTELSADIIQDFSFFIDKIRENNIEINFFLIPYPEKVYNYLISRQKYNIIHSVENFVKLFAKKNNIIIYGSYDPNLCDIITTDFFDGMHLNEKGIEKYMNNIVKKR